MTGDSSTRIPFEKYVSAMLNVPRKGVALTYSWEIRNTKHTADDFYRAVDRNRRIVASTREQASSK